MTEGIQLPLLSAESRPVGLRMRRDLVVSEHELGGRLCCVIKDPLTLRHYQLRIEEFALLQMLDGRISLAEMKERFERRFAPARLSIARLQVLLGRFHRDGLVVADSVGQGEQLWRRTKSANRRASLQSVLSVLAIRFRGINPNPLLDVLYPRVRWFFHPIAMIAAAALVASAVALVIVQFDTLWSRLPSLSAFLSPANLVWMAATLACVKVLHELGHGLTCKHFGGECNELGLMLLVFTPCLYCNVSDSWMIRGKWQRASVAGAGIVVELVIAALCTWLWWFSQPGLLNSICLNAMLICSVGTIAFNGNPLLRYDGYFVLSDLLEAPNLWQQSRALRNRWLGHWCLGIDVYQDMEIQEHRQAWLGVYSIVSTLYRVAVVIAIGLFVLRTFRVMQVAVIGQAIVALAAVGMTVGPLMAVARFAAHPSRRGAVKLSRLNVTLAISVVALATFAWLPLPRRVAAPAIVTARDAEPVYVVVPGHLRWAIRDGEQVVAGQELARLDSAELAVSVAKRRGEHEQLESRLASLESRRGDDPDAAALIPTVRESLAGVNRELERLDREVQRLTLIAPRDGIVLSPRPVKADLTDASELAEWSGTPLDSDNVGCFLETGSLICEVGDAGSFKATLYLVQSEIESIAVGQTVCLKLDSLPGETIYGTIRDLAQADLREVPRELLLDGQIPVRARADDAPRPWEAIYEARVEFPAHNAAIVNRTRGQAKVSVAPRSLGWRTIRYLARTFTFEYRR